MRLSSDKNDDRSFHQHSDVLCESYKPPIWLFWKSRRYIVTLLVFFGLFCDYGLRVNLNVAIVPMTQAENVTLQNGTVVLKREFDWDTKIQGHMLSSFYYGYLVTQMVGGYLSTKFGGKPVFTVGIGGMAILNLLTPYLSKMNICAIFTVRIVEGLFEGLLFPCVNDIFAKWSSPSEKSRFVTFGFSGAYMGTLVSLQVSSLLASNFGWESVFYAFGIFGCLWTLLWVLIVSNSPAEDPHISKAELEYILTNAKDNEIKEKLVIPWKQILTSLPVWALTMAVACKAWGFFVLLSYLPKFVKNCLNYNLEQAGFMAALPYLVMSILIQVSGQILDYMETKQVLTATHLRKLMVGVGLLLQCVFMVLAVHWLSVVGSNLSLIMAIGLGGFAMAVFTVNPLDLSPKYGSIIGGINHTCGTISGILSPTITGYIVTEETDVNQWRIVFYISSAIYLLGAVLFCCFGSAELQPWDSCDKSNDGDKKRISPNYINKGFDSSES